MVLVFGVGISCVHFAWQHSHHHRDANAAHRYAMASQLVASLFPPGAPVQLHSLSAAALTIASALFVPYALAVEDIPASIPASSATCGASGTIQISAGFCLCISAGRAKWRPKS